MTLRLRLVARAGAATALASAVVLSAAGAGLAGPGQGQGQDRNTPPAGSARKEAAARERVTGVIIKVEKATGGVDSERKSPEGRARTVTHRLTLNTNAVWRDWARDQAQMADTGSPAKDAAKGANSVATKGEPADRNAKAVVNIGQATRVETRFRAPDDETSPGKTAAELHPTTDAKGARTTPPRLVEFRVDDLKPGLWVEADSRYATSQAPASALYVIRPIGGPHTAAEKERPR